MINSLRGKLFIWFLSFSLVTMVLIVVFNIYYANQRKQINTIVEQFNHIHKILLKDRIAINEFFIYEISDSIYFVTGYSEYTELHEQHAVQINNAFKDMKRESHPDFYDTSVINDLHASFLKYNVTFSKIDSLLQIRGFKDYGKVGQMRNYVHRLERFTRLDKVDVLSLRRNEKDYIIRNEMMYVENLNSIADQLIRHYTGINHPDRVESVILENLVQYKKLFNEIVELDRIIGIRGNDALKKRLETESKTLLHKTDSVITKLARLEASINSKLKGFYVLYVIMVILLGVIMSTYLSKKFIRPIYQISNYINDFVGKDFKKDEPLLVDSKSPEINTFVHNFRILQNEIWNYMKFFKEKVNMKTREIMSQRDQILQQMEEIETQRDELDKKNQVIEKQKNEVEEKNKDVISSIKYAQKIQHSILPDAEYVHDCLPESFVYYEPKDIVSGDFYWVEHISNGKDKGTLCAVADCTGHGVPGAFMSLLGYNGLNHALNDDNTNDLKKIMTQLNETVYKSLHRKNGFSDINDSLDIALCYIDFYEREIEFLGAYRPMYLIRNRDLTEYSGSKLSIGNMPDISRKLELKKIPYQKGDTIYMFTDGYTDQIGGPDNKKLKFKKFRNLLTSISNEPMDIQKGMLRDYFLEWRGSEEQIDDILVMGIRL